MHGLTPLSFSYRHSILEQFVGADDYEARRIHSEQTPFDLVAIDSPAAILLLFTAVEFQVGSGTNLFDEPTKQERLAAVKCATSKLPTANPAVDECQVSTDAK